MKHVLSLFLVIGLSVGFASAQTQSSATATITVTAARQQATVTATPQTQSAAAGTTATLNVSVAGPSGAAVPTGNVQLLVEAPGATTYTALPSMFALVNGSVTCTYSIPSDAPLGPYSIEAVYQGNSSYY